MKDGRERLEQEVVPALHSLREIEPPDEGRQKAQRAVFMSQARRHASAMAASRQGSRTSQRRDMLMPFMRSRKWALAGVMVAMLLVFVAGTGGAIYAADNAVPGDTLYGLDQAVESARLRVTSRPEAVVSLLLAIAQERLDEANALLEQGDIDNLAAALDGYGSTLSSLTATLESVEESEVQELASLVDTSFAGEAAPASSVPADANTEPDREDPAPADDDYCTGTQSHPVALALVAAYGEQTGVTEGQIMDWFCQDHYGFGEIMLALETSLRTTTGAEAPDLFASLEELGGWGKVWQEEGLIGKGRASVAPPSAFPVGPSAEADVPEVASAGPERAGAELDEPAEWCVGVAEHPVAAELAESYGVSYEQIMEWFCNGRYGLGEIKLALETAAESTEPLLPGYLLQQKTELGGWGRVWQSLGLIGKPESGNAAEEPPEGEQPEGDGLEYCVGADPHPVALKLSETYSEIEGVDYDTIMDWFCNGKFGFGEIKLALDASDALSEETELPEACAEAAANGDTLTECLLALRTSEGWGQVWHELGFLGKPSKGKSIAPADENPLDTEVDQKVPPGQLKEKKPKPQKPPKPVKPAKPAKPEKPGNSGKS